MYRDLLHTFTGIGVLVAMAACYRAPKGYRYVLPEGYAGWVCVEHGVAGAPPLPLEDDYRLVKVPRDGVVRTADAIKTDPIRDEWYFDSSRGRAPASEPIAGFTVQDKPLSQGKGERVSAYKFFGTREQWEEEKKRNNVSGRPIPGWIQGSGDRP